MKWFRLFALMGIGLFSTTGPALGAVYYENFDTDPGGWTVSYGLTYFASGGVNNSGYIQGSRSHYAPTFYPISGDAEANATGNFNEIYGDLVRITYYGRAFSGGDQAVRHFLGSGSTWWYHDDVAPIDAYLTEWTFTEVLLDTTWTNQDAFDAGWTRQQGSLSWAETMTNITVHYPFYAWRSEHGSGDTFVSVGGFDELTIESLDANAVPLPATAMLLIFGGVLLRRQRA